MIKHVWVAINPFNSTDIQVRCSEPYSGEIFYDEADHEKYVDYKLATLMIEDDDD